MLINKTTFCVMCVCILLVFSDSSHGVVEPERSGIALAEFSIDDLAIQHQFKTTKQLPDQASLTASSRLTALGVNSNLGRIDVRGGRWATLMMSKPLIPGDGKGNKLRWTNIRKSAPSSEAELKNEADRAVRNFIGEFSQSLQIDQNELAPQGKVTLHKDGDTIQLYLPREYQGVAVHNSYITATVSHGNLILFGANDWGDIEVSTKPKITANTARNSVQSHVADYKITGYRKKPELILLPLQKNADPNSNPVGQGYTHRLVWVIQPTFDNVMQNYEAFVDAHSGEILSFKDTNHYVTSRREVLGGVLPVTNDGVVPDGVEQPGWPMPFATVTTPSGSVTTDGGGNLPFAVDGDITSTLSGEYVHMNDNCGAISLTSAGDLDFGTSAGTDCTTPGTGGAGNTHASRSGFHELNRIIEMGRGQLPSNNWLTQQLTSNMNINQSCNAFWNGASVNFYRSGGVCANTGEIAGVFDHEWGHGLDDNDAVPTIASPSGEGIADIYTALRLNSSCIGRNFFPTNCTGFGDACLSCTGVRDIDYLKRTSGSPHTYTWSNANCGSSVHCIGSVYSEAVWSLWKRELQGAPYNYDDYTAHEIVTRLTYIGAGNTGVWFSGGPPNGGCAATSGYMNYLAADDDNGDLADGTPHMAAIYKAFNDQEIACATPTVQDAGCSGSPSTAPVVAATALDKGVELSWGNVANASVYEVYRTDSVFGCDFGKTRVGETAGNSFTDSGLQNGRDYSYVVIPKGSSSACFGPASACVTEAPVAGPDLDIAAESVVFATSNGDADEYIDNCEDATLTFDVTNTGAGDHTNVRITSVTVESPSGTTVTSSFPIAVSPSLEENASQSTLFAFNAGGLSFGDNLVFEVSFTSDELAPTIKQQTLTLRNAESDSRFLASKTWDFESGLEGWTVIQGTFNQTTAGGGASGSAGYVASSTLSDNQCDQIRSPEVQLTATSTLSLFNNYNIEDFNSQWWDRANVAVFDGSNREAKSPSSGRTYNASGAGATCVTANQSGWAGANDSWGVSGWSAVALGAPSHVDAPVQLDIAYGTDPSVNGKGFWFDRVTLTDITIVKQDAQSSNCVLFDAQCFVIKASNGNVANVCL